MDTILRRGFLGQTLGLGGAALLGGARIQDAPKTPAEALDRIGRTPRTKYAINIEMWFRGMSYEDKIRRTAALGFSAVEMWPWRGKNLDSIAIVCKETGVSITQFTGWGFEPGLNDPRNHDHFEKEIEESCAAARRLGVKILCVVGGNDQPGMSQKDMHDHIVLGLKRGAPIAEKNDVTLVLEPMNIRIDHKGHCLYGSAPAIDIVKRVDSSHVKILWDLYHMEITEGDLCHHLREGIAHIGYVQIADNPGRNDPGTGEINYKRVMKELFDLGYRGHVGCEFTPIGDDVAAARAVAACDGW